MVCAAMILYSARWRLEPSWVVVRSNRSLCSARCGPGSYLIGKIQLWGLEGNCWPAGKQQDRPSESDHLLGRAGSRAWSAVSRTAQGRRTETMKRVTSHGARWALGVALTALAVMVLAIPGRAATPVQVPFKVT